MPDRSDNGNSNRTSSSALDPIERSSEIMFGLIMALTFTCTVSVATSTRNDVMTMLASALGCNIAWGIVDAAMFLLAQTVARERRQSVATTIAAATPSEARQLLLENLPDGSGKILDEHTLDRLAAAIRTMPVPERHVMPTQDDLRSAGTVFLLVFLSTLPVALPFLLMSDVATALRTSNAIAIGLLFVVGSNLGRHMKWQRYWIAGLSVAILGALLVAIAIALGG